MSQTADCCQTFEAALYSAVTDPNSPYVGLQNAFLWQGRELRAWKMTILPPFMTTSQEKSQWMVRIRYDIIITKDLFIVHVSYLSSI